MAETRKVDSRGRDLTKPRGPKPRPITKSVAPVHVTLPLEMVEELDMRGALHPERRADRNGRSPVVRDALVLLFQGDAESWRRKYVAERQARQRAELALQRIRQALGDV